VAKGAAECAAAIGFQSVLVAKIQLVLGISGALY
jgi:hypothetical protein